MCACWQLELDVVHDAVVAGLRALLRDLLTSIPVFADQLGLEAQPEAYLPLPT